MISTIRNVPLTEISNLKKLGSSNMESIHYRVLVVDDEEPIRKLIATMLSQQGHQCITASNGIELQRSFNLTQPYSPELTHR